MKLGLPEDNRLQRAYAVLDRQSIHMMRLIDDLLQVSRIALDKIKLVRERLDLRDVANAVVQDPSGQLAASGLELCSELPPEPI